MAETPEKKAYKIIDVSHPDATAADPSSKPIIVSNRPVLKDPMMVDEADQKDAKPVPTTGKKIMPISEAESKSAKDKDDGSEKITVKTKAAAVKAEKEEAAEEKSEDKAPEPEASEPPAHKPEEEPAAEPGPETPEEATPTEGDEETVDEATAAEFKAIAEKEAAVQKLVDNETYFLPTNTVHKRHVRLWIIGVFLFLILLGGAVFLLAWDAGMVSVGNLKPPTNFLPN